MTAKAAERRMPLVRKVGIIVKQGSDIPRRICAELVAWFAERGIASVVDAVQPDLDMLVILGGDGTLLHVADEASRHRIPVVGVNLGGLGFLTEVAVSERYEALAAILAGTVAVEERMLLRARLRGERGAGPWFYALNEVVLGRSDIDRLVTIAAWADDEYITTYRADGLIFSTPTGSTAYNLSAGGPIVHPGLNAILVTPICPFMLESRPVLLPASARIRSQLAGKGDGVNVIVDGRPALCMERGEHLEVEASERPLLLIAAPRKGYFEILRNKLNWGGVHSAAPRAGAGTD